MSPCSEFIQKLNTLLPSLVTTQELVDVGVYASPQSAYHARKVGKCPAYFRIPSRGIVYPKAGVLEFMKKHAIERTTVNAASK